MHTIEKFIMNIEIRCDYDTICREVAQKIAALIRTKPNAVLGLATGSTPLGVYDELDPFAPRRKFIVRAGAHFSI